MTAKRSHKQVVDGKYVCGKCKQLKNITEFSRSAVSPTGYSNRCKACDKEYYDAANAEKRSRRARNRHLIRKFGISLEKYETLLLKQNYLCAICEQPEVRKAPNSAEVITLIVDHDHSTGKVRGLLCHKCNAGLGHFRDSVYILAKTIDYLEKFSE